MLAKELKTCAETISIMDAELVMLEFMHLVLLVIEVSIYLLAEVATEAMEAFMM